jgi:hypothetical protein
MTVDQVLNGGNPQGDRKLLDDLASLPSPSPNRILTAPERKTWSLALRRQAAQFLEQAKDERDSPCGNADRQLNLETEALSLTEAATLIERAVLIELGNILPQPGDRLTDLSAIQRQTGSGK